MHHVIWCEGTVYICAYWTCYQHHICVGVLSEEYIFSVPGKVLWAARRSCHGLTHQPYSGKFIYGRFWDQSSLYISPPPSLWKRYVDATFVVINSAHKSNFLDHFNYTDQCTQFTGEDSRADGSIPFLAILVIPLSGGSLNKSLQKTHPHWLLFAVG